MTATDGRKSLMLDHPEYTRVSAAAKRFGVSRPAVIQALLDLVDERQLGAKLADIKAANKALSAVEAAKRRALSQLGDKLSLSEIVALVGELPS